ncbi:MAG: PAS domain-containing sensor histidine kinase [Thermomicrobiales bacterium]
MAMDNVWREPTTAIDRIVRQHNDRHGQQTPRTDPILDLPQRRAHEQSHGVVTNGRNADMATAPFDALAIPVVCTNPAGIVTGWNRAATTLFGYTAREALGKRLLTIPPEEDERYVAFQQRIAMGETITGVVVEQIHKDGHRARVLLSAAPWYDAGEMMGVVMTLADLSAQQTREWELAAQAATEARRARDAAYLAAVADACYAARDERAIFDALAACTAGWSDSAGVVITSEGSSTLVAYAARTADTDGVIAALFPACAAGCAGLAGQDAIPPDMSRIYHLCEIPLGGATTAQRYHSLAAAPVVAEGEIVATLYAAACGAHAPLDATSRTTLASAAAHAGRAIVTVRTYQELTARLDALEAETRQKDDFLATVSHELRTPLTAILGFAHIIVENDALGAARRRGMAEDIVASGGLLLTQVNDLLDIVQLGAGRLAVALESVDLTTVMQWCERAVRALMHSKNLRFTLAIPANLPPARANTARLQQVLLNFLVNAYKFTPTGGAVTLVATAMEGSVAISVRDTGIGIATEHVARIFEPFARIESDYTRTQSGAGVGLAVARQLVDLMGGTIILDSTPTVGSTFTVSLNVAAGA